MIVFLLLIAALCLYKIKIANNGYFDDFLEREQTNSIKGLFILFVFLRHSLQYVVRNGYKFNSFGDSIVFFTNGMLGQLIVVMFLFYSGYGVMEAIKYRGYSYITKMPRNRILPTLLNFDIAVLCFVIVDILLDIQINSTQVLLSLTGWDSVGNSNWYIFVILICYIITYLFISKEKLFWGIFLIIVVAAILRLSGKAECWYNTILSYPAGILFSRNKEMIIGLWKKYYWSVLFAIVFFFCVLFPFRSDCISLKYNILSVLFAFIVVQITMKIKISNSILCWLGINLFPLYIYQRIPMILLCKKTFAIENPLLFMMVSLIVTVFIAWLYRYWRVK